MCKEYVNLQTKEKLDLDKVNNLKDNYMLKQYPHYFIEWDFDKNKKIDIYSITKGMEIETWWICSHCLSNYNMKTLYERRRLNKCPYCSGKRRNETNSLANKYPELLKLWDFEKNSISPYEITSGVSTKVWWYCEKCDDSYPQSITKKVTGRGCSICKGYYTTPKNSFGGKFPELSSEWHPTKNGNLTPYDVSYGSGKLAWFKCGKCTMDYECTIDKKTTQNAKCPYCRGLRISPFNNFKVTHPEIAELWNYELNKGYLPEQFVKNNNKFKFYWKCNSCGEEDYKTIKNKTKCPNCTDVLSFGERYMYKILKLNNIEFIREMTFEWSDNKRFDFYIPSHNTVIEIHGLQHYKRSPFFNNRGTSFEEIQDNDQYKYSLAVNNGISNYIVVKSINQSLIKFINEIELSGLLNVLPVNLNLIKEHKIPKNNSVKLYSWEMWNEGFSVKEISDLTQISDRMIRRYLTDGTKLGKCEFPKKKNLNKIT